MALQIHRNFEGKESGFVVVKAPDGGVYTQFYWGEMFGCTEGEAERQARAFIQAWEGQQ